LRVLFSLERHELLDRGIGIPLIRDAWWDQPDGPTKLGPEDATVPAFSLLPVLPGEPSWSAFDLASL
jgi:hypothetical protein